MSDTNALATLDDVGEHLLQLFPESATSLGVDTGTRATLRSQLTDRSAAGRVKIATQLRTDLARVNAIDTKPLTHATRTTVEVVQSAFGTALGGLALPYGDTTVGSWRNTPYVVIQNVGAYLDIPKMLDTDHPIENAADAEAYLARMQAYAKQLDGETDRIRAARGLGVVPPAFLIEKTLNQIRVSGKNAHEGGSLVESITRRTKNIPGSWADRARTIAQKEVAPALDRQIAELETEHGVAKNDAGVWAQPHGDEFYRWALKASTTTAMSPDEIHETGKREEPGAPAAYGGPGSIDGKIPGRFWINLGTTKLHRKYDLADLAFHESIPGHIWQGEYTRKMPRVRQMLGFNAYTEGWALYAEQLADELGAYDNDAVGRLGYLQSIAFRACRLVVDTGIHAKHWTREQGVKYFVDMNGSNPLEVASEVDRYCSWPGQACGYKIGHTEINRQRERAKTALGGRYDLKMFNDTVVLGGDVPLDVLGKNVGEYVGGDRW